VAQNGALFVESLEEIIHDVEVERWSQQAASGLPFGACRIIYLNDTLAGIRKNYLSWLTSPDRANREKDCIRGLYQLIADYS
jgi:hypothetical protein